MTRRNNVTRFLDARQISFTAFELPAEKLGATETARLLGVAPGIVFKTIVVVRENPKKPVLAVIPGPCQVDLKKIAKFLGEKKVSLPTEREAERLTGLQAGGISPLALLNKGFVVLFDLSVQQSEAVHISGGERGLNLKMAARDLLALTQARLADITQKAVV